MLDLSLLLISWFLLLSIAFKKFNELHSFIFIFLLFTLLYTALPIVFILADGGINVNFTLPLLDESHTAYVARFQVAIYILLAVSLYFGNFRKIISSPDEAHFKLSFGRHLVFVYSLLYIPALFTIYIYHWPEFGANLTLGHSIASYIVSIYIILFSSVSIRFRKGTLSKHIYLLIALSMFILILVYSARTPFFILLFILSWSFNLKLKRIIKYFPVFLALFALFIYITLSRNNIEFSFDHIAYPFFVEALYGGYGSLQIQEVISSVEIPFYSFLYPFIDSLIYLIPSAIFDIFDVVKVSGMLETAIVANAFESGALEHKFQPMGGHFYLGEYLMVFGLATPFVFIFYILIFFKIVQKIKNEISLIMYASSFLIIKSPISSIFKYYISIMILYFILYILFRIVFLKKKS
jgi:hypothetical protein